MSSMRKVALAYAKLGIPVIPMHGAANGKCTCTNSSCTGPAKHPHIKGGVNAATTDLDQIRRWWTQWPNANIGLATGSASGLCVLDVDPRNGGRETMAKLVKTLGPLPRTAKVLTGGGGYHLYFAAPAFPVKRDTAGKVLGPGADVLGEGSIAIAPYSRHVSGNTYRYVKGLNLIKGAKPKELPKLWCERIHKGQTSTPSTKLNEVGAFSKIAQGRRNNTLMKIAGHLVNTGLTDEAILQCLLLTNQSRCLPPLAETEVKAIADSAATYRPTTVRSIHDTPEYVAYAMTLAEHYAGGRHLRFLPGHGFHVYDQGMWTLVEANTVEQVVLNTIENLPARDGRKAMALLSNVIRLISIKQTVPSATLYGDAHLPIINCRNGELWIEENGSVSLRTHSPDSNLTYCLPVDYDPIAKCPQYDKAIRQIFAEADSPKDMARHWNEVAGYLIQSTRDIPLILMLLGAGSNGKSELWRTLAELIGAQHVYSGTLDHLERHRFMIGFLRGKLLFVDDDIKAGAKLPDGTLKRISEGKLLTGELKGRDAFQFTGRALPVLLANNEPTTADLSWGMQRRMMVIPFKHKFREGKDLDRKLWPLIRRTEMSGILNRLVSGLGRLRKRNSMFKEPAEVREAKKQWLQNANPLVAFLDQCTKRDKSSSILVTDLYAAYGQWASKSGITFQLQRNRLKRQLEQLGYNVGNSNRGVKVIGLRLRRERTS